MFCSVVKLRIPADLLIDQKPMNGKLRPADRRRRRPNNDQLEFQFRSSDLYHTCYCLSGLSLFQQHDQSTISADTINRLVNLSTNK